MNTQDLVDAPLRMDNAVVRAATGSIELLMGCLAECEGSGVLGYLYGLV